MQSDYEKTAAFRALMRARRQIPAPLTNTQAYYNFSRFLAKVDFYTVTHNNSCPLRQSILLKLAWSCSV